jgi:hypothetical protein
MAVMCMVDPLHVVIVYSACMVVAFTILYVVIVYSVVCAWWSLHVVIVYSV